MRKLLAALLLIAPWTGVFAERADRQKPMHVESDRMSADDIKQVAVFTGRVVVTQGTFTLCADEVTVREDKAGNQSGTAIGNPARFREKRDGVDEWIEGEALRIEYDNTSELVELFGRAKVNREKDEVHGDYISYDGKTEFIKVQHEKGQPEGAPPNDQRVYAIFNPKPRPAQGAPAATPASPGTKLQPDAALPGSKSSGDAARPAFCR